MIRIGVDVGGTNTDAVLMNGTAILASTKTPTTADVEGGIALAIRTVLADAACDPAALRAVMIGTTHFTNAFVEGTRLDRVGVIRLGFPATTAIPPLYGWPDALIREVAGGHAILPGGHEFDGRPISPFDGAKVADAARGFRDAGLEAVAISSVFAPLSRAQEEEAAAIVRSVIPHARVSLSADFGRLGLLERENAATMNASLLALAEHTIGAFERSLRTLGIAAPLFISQNDGTLMSAARATQFPVATFASGPTNSMRGAALLAGISEALVIDIGGTTADIGYLHRGFPRESALTVDIGGVRTNFRMPDLVSLALGGGTIIHRDAGRVSIGPRSVGYEIIRRARIFGGDTLTATDIAVAAGMANVGDPSRVGDLEPDFVQKVVADMRAMVEAGLERMKLNAAPIPAILVGGGSLLLGDTLDGTSTVIRPENFAVANAVGAAIAQVGGEIDEYISYERTGRESALASARQSAEAAAIAAGARPDSIELVELEEYPVAYLAGNVTRVRAKVVGDMAEITA